MQCPRCYYTNTEGTRVCEYCGAQLETGTDPAVGGGGKASSKRKTMLGPAPSAMRSKPAAPLTTPRIDPRDPFKIAAEGIRNAQPEAPPPPIVTPPVVVKPTEPAPPVVTPPPKAPAPRRPRPTMIVGAGPTSAAAPLAGVALVIPLDGEAHSVMLREGRTRIGRRQDMEIVVQDLKASTEHALLRLENGEAWLLDTSANGTRVAGQLCLNDRATVTDGTVLRVGDTAIVLKLLSPECLAQIAADDA